MPDHFKNVATSKPRSLGVPDDFRRQIDDDTRNCILLVGAGFSNFVVRARGRRLPDWSTLAEMMIHDLRGRVTRATSARLRSMLEKSQLLDIAEEFKNSTRGDAYASFLRRQIDPPDLVRSDVHDIALAIEFRGIITTNFDRIIEFHTDRFRPWSYPYFLEETAWLQRGGFLAKIHGCISSPNPAKNLVLAKSDYQKLAKNKKYQQLIKSLIFGHTILIVGFSLTDPDFLGVVDSLHAVFQDGFPSAYALIRGVSPEQRIAWRKRGIEIIPYREHRQLRGFFAELLELSETKYQSGRLKTVPFAFTKVSDVKAQAWEFYSNWKQGTTYSPALKRNVAVTVKGWKHVTRRSRPQPEVCHKLSLLPCAREVIETCREAVLVRKLVPYVDASGRLVLRDLHVLRGRSQQPFRADIWVFVVIELKTFVDEDSVLGASFYSVYERRV
jgi:hypothetical protein